MVHVLTAAESAVLWGEGLPGHQSITSQAVQVPDLRQSALHCVL